MDKEDDLVIGISLYGIKIYPGAEKMLGPLNLWSFSLLAGAFGQYWFYSGLFPGAPEWFLLGTLLVPWLTAYIITVAKRPPFGPRPFRFCLLFVMGWYLLASLCAEVIKFFVRPSFNGPVSITAARIIMGLGLLCFVPYIRAFFTLRRMEDEQNKTITPVHQ